MKRAEELFMQGFNCAQSVAAAFADVYGYTEEQMLRVSAGFGAGIGRLRMSCGAFNAMALLAGLENGSVTPGDQQGKSQNYKLVQELAARFQQEHGSLICAELLKLKRGNHLPPTGGTDPPRRGKMSRRSVPIDNLCRILHGILPRATYDDWRQRERILVHLARSRCCSTRSVG